MHTVVIRRDIYERHRWVAQSLYKAFAEAQRLTYDDLIETSALKTMLPWLIAHVEETRGVMGHEFWPYGACSESSDPRDVPPLFPGAGAGEDGVERRATLRPGVARVIHHLSHSSRPRTGHQNGTITSSSMNSMIVSASPTLNMSFGVKQPNE